MSIVIGPGATIGPGITIGPAAQPVTIIYLLDEEGDQLITEGGDDFILEN
jgi:hypothetical protein